MTPAALALPDPTAPAALARARRAPGDHAPARPRLVAPGAAAAYLGIAPRTLRSWIALGRVPVVRLGRTVRVDVADLDALIAAAKFGGVA